MNTWPLAGYFFSDMLCNIIQHLGVRIITALRRVLVTEEVVSEISFFDIGLMFGPPHGVFDNGVRRFTDRWVPCHGAFM